MKQSHVFIDAELVILSSEEGGRATPLSVAGYGGHYRPQIVLQPRDVRQAMIEMRGGLRHITDEYLAIAFWNGPDPIPIAKPFTVTLVLIYPEHPAYDRMVPDADFTLREGEKIVGHGRVLRRWKDENG